MSGSVPLSAASRSLLELGSEVRPPSAEQAERMRRALEPVFAEQSFAEQLFAEQPSAGSLSAAERPAPSAAPPRRPRAESNRADLGAPLGTTARTWAARSKLFCTLGALAATASASFWLGRVSREVPAGPPPARASVVAAQPRDLAAASPAPALLAPALLAMEPPGTATTPATPAPATLRTATRSALGARGGKTAPRGLAAEIEQLTQVEAALRQGRAAAALRDLEGTPIHELVEQSAALRAIAECTLGRRHAEQKARTLLAQWRESAYQARVRDACGL
jgi:hypothetical protein